MANSVFLTPGGFSNNGSAIVFPVNTPWDVQATGLGTTSTDGGILENTTAATAGTTVQISPRLRLRGTAYNSSSTLSETQDWWIENLPATAAGATTSTLRIGVSLNGGTTTFPMQVTNAGVFSTVSGGRITTGVAPFDSVDAIGLGNGDVIGRRNSGNTANWNLIRSGGHATDDTTVGTSNSATYIDGNAFFVMGNQGVTTFGPSSVTSITVKNGIITAIS